VQRPLEALRWDNSYSRLAAAFFERVAPTPLPDPYLVAFNRDAAALLELDPAEAARPGFLAALNGDRTLPGTTPIATIYAGHQFGVWVPQLGDGRAILLGEVVTDEHARWDVQLKGSGPTRFSRMGDGRAVLRSTIREYLAGEAMHALGIPTTRALAIFGSDAPVYRERVETAAVLVRLAPTHVRFGTFQLFASRGQHDAVTQLADYVIEHHFPDLLKLPARERYAAWYAEVVDRTARLIARWTAVGFSHGVMNTDNMSVLGLTLDYGPYGWLDGYDRGFICNHTDEIGRYAFDQQPKVGLWNCARFGEAILTLMSEETALAALDAYRHVFEAEIDALMGAKLGFGVAEPDDLALLTDFLALLQRTHADYTRTFRALSRYTAADPATLLPLRAEVSEVDALDAWLARYTARLDREQSVTAERHSGMLAVNPKYVLRNWVAQEVITNAEARNYDKIEEVRLVLAAPFDEHRAFEHYAAAPPEWARHIAVSCSS
jgi:uncharacterized protein YdiU (UPF0061 family)